MAAPLRQAGYGYIETPTFESTTLFERGVGESTDVVSKEMYSFTTRGGDHLTLKPEGTAGVVRAVIQHRLYAGQLPVKLWYSGRRPAAIGTSARWAPKRSASTTRRWMPSWSRWRAASTPASG
jgi:histidyl-tRNA synthetase